MGFLSANKADNSYALNEAFADLQIAHAGFAYADSGSVKTAVTAVANGAPYDENPLKSFDLTGEEVTLNGDMGQTLELQIVAIKGDALDVSTFGISASGLNIEDIDLAENDGLAIVKFDQAIALIDKNLGKIGAQINRLSHAMQVNANTVENLSAARSRILDADIAYETTALAKQSILQQAGISMLSQASITPELALRLLG